MEFKSIGIEFEFNLIWRGETKINAKSIKNLLAISNICDYGVEKKGLLRKNTNPYLRMHLSFHLEKISHQKIYFGRMK